MQNRGNAGRAGESFSENECDAIYVGLLSENDAEHEKDLDVLREICQNTAVPVIGSGHIFRMEDVKKLLYAGCQQVMLDYADPVQLELTKEVSLKFGKEKIAAGVADISLLEQEKELLKEYTSNVFLFCPGATAEAALMSPVPVVTFLPEVSLEKLIEVLSYANISGISGKLVNENITEISAIKALCRENKIPVEDRGAAYAFSDLKKGPDGLVPVVVQDVKTDAVLMVAVYERRSLQSDVAHRTHDLLQQKPQRALVKGRNQRTLSVCAFSDCGLRPGYNPCKSNTGRRGMPHRFLQLFL